MEALARLGVSVPLEGEEIVCVQDGENLWVSLRRICEALGIDVDSQRKKLLEKPWGQTLVMPVKDTAGREQPMFMVHIDCLPMWLAGLEPTRVAPEAADALTAYQLRCAKVLRDYFFRPAPIVPVDPKPSKLRRVLFQHALEAVDAAHQAGLLDRKGFALRKAALLRDMGLDVLATPRAEFTGAGVVLTPAGPIVSGPAIVLPLNNLEGTYSARALGEPYGLSSTRVNELGRQAEIYGVE